MHTLFNALILLCAREDNRYRSVPLVMLLLLIALAVVPALVSSAPAAALLHGATALVLATPFAVLARLGRCGPADSLGVLAVSLRFDPIVAPAVIAGACMAGLLPAVLARHREHPVESKEEIPFFPCLAVATIFAGRWM